MKKIIGYAILGFMVGLGINMYLYRNSPTRDTPLLPFIAVLFILTIIGGFVGRLLMQRDVNRDPARDALEIQRKKTVLRAFFSGLVVVIAVIGLGVLLSRGNGQVSQASFLTGLIVWCFAILCIIVIVFIWKLDKSLQRGEKIKRSLLFLVLYLVGSFIGALVWIAMGFMYVLMGISQI
jgi:hypothetical protein